MALPQSQNKVSLTIGLPVYNEAKVIRGTLDSILSQLNNDNIDHIKILISDNCSTDATPEICREYLAKYPNNVVYFRNDENLGALKNLTLAAERATTDFFWYCGDDQFYDGAIDHTLSFLSRNPQLGVIYSGIDVYDNALENITVPHEKTNKGRDIVCSDIGELLIHARDKMYCLSCTVFKLTAWHKYYVPEAAINAYPHSIMLMKIASREPSGVIDAAMIKQRPPTWWRDDNIEFCYLVSSDTLSLYKNDIAPEKFKYYPQFFYSVQVINGFFRPRMWNLLSIEKKQRVIDLYFDNDLFLYAPEKKLTAWLLKQNFNLGVKFLRLLMKAEGKYGMMHGTKNPVHYLFFAYWSVIDLFNLKVLGKSPRYFFKAKA